MDKILTILVPTYNMEQYLHKCLDSLLIQDEELLNRFEVLVINDGSKDLSSIIAHKYQSKYPTVFRVIDKENGNYGSCINRGFKEARGKYVKILDADDSFDTEVFSSYLLFLSSIDADMVITDYMTVDERGRIGRIATYPLPARGIFYISEIKNNVNIEMHALTYRSSMLREMKYYQTEGISYTDVEWSVIPLRKVEIVAYFPKILYLYLVGRQGQTIDTNVKIKNVSMMNRVLLSIIQDYCNNVHHGEDLYLRGKIMKHADTIYKLYLSTDLDKNDLECLDLKIKTMSTDIYDLLNQCVISRYFPFHYIRAWRHGKTCSLFFVWKAYNIAHKVRNFFVSKLPWFM